MKRIATLIPYSFLLAIILLASCDHRAYTISQGNELEVTLDGNDLEFYNGPCQATIFRGSTKSRDSIQTYQLAAFEDRDACFKLGFRIIESKENRPVTNREFQRCADEILDKLWWTVYFEFSVEIDGELYSNLWSTGIGRNDFQNESDFQLTDDFSVILDPNIAFFNDLDCNESGQMIFEGNAQGYLYTDDYSDYILIDYARFYIELPME